MRRPSPGGSSSGSGESNPPVTDMLMVENALGGWMGPKKGRRRRRILSGETPPPPASVFQDPMTGAVFDLEEIRTVFIV